ncbi:MAG: hypothetical protein KatS3mg053_3867 [Candidatus Roseilinea sp.]|nr:MAG: hypothetical protein KatS3mg053_3867 [Candidatus Roseilinea sp.]
MTCGTEDHATTGGGGIPGCGTIWYGQVVARQWYHPYGSVRAITGTLPTDITFTGQRSDATGLYFYNARYYAPALGRFVSADTVVPEPGNPQDLNRYTYVRNNPLRYTDPTGHQADEVCQVLSCLSNEQKAQLQRRLESTRLGRAMFDKLRAKEIDLLQQVTIAVMPRPSGGISLPLASDHFGSDVHWQSQRSGHLIIVPPSANGQDPLADARWVALVGHELFHAFQREVAHELPEHAHRDREFTTKQFEREALIFEFSVFLELTSNNTGDPQMREQRKTAQSSLQALAADAHRAREWFAQQNHPVYNRARDDLRGGGLAAMHAWFMPPRIK